MRHQLKTWAGEWASERERIIESVNECTVAMIKCICLLQEALASFRDLIQQLNRSAGINEDVSSKKVHKQSFTSSLPVFHVSPISFSSGPKCWLMGQIHAWDHILKKFGVDLCKDK